MAGISCAEALLYQVHAQQLLQLLQPTLFSGTQIPCIPAGGGSVVMCSTFSGQCYGKFVLCWPAAEVRLPLLLLLSHLTVCAWKLAQRGSQVAGGGLQCRQHSSLCCRAAQLHITATHSEL
jgi:hypothetical protein